MNNLTAEEFYDLVAKEQTDLVEDVLNNANEAEKKELLGFDPSGDTPLLLAAQCGYTRLVSILLDHKANINDKECGQSNIFLMAAMHPNFIEVASVLFSKGDCEALLTQRNGMQESVFYTCLTKNIHGTNTIHFLVSQAKTMDTLLDFEKTAKLYNVNYPEALPIVQNKIKILTEKETLNQTISFYSSNNPSDITSNKERLLKI